MAIDENNRTNQVLDLFHISGGAFYRLTFEEIKQQVNRASKQWER